MEFDSSILLTLTINIGLIVIFSLLTVQLLNKTASMYLENNKHLMLVSKIIKDRLVIIPRCKTTLIIRRMIKAKVDVDETKFHLLS